MTIARVNISMSHDLRKRITAVQNRGNFPVSTICRAALEQAIIQFDIDIIETNKEQSLFSSRL